jgi:RHS repeat-associated protein
VGGVLAVDIATNGTHFTACDGNGNITALVSVVNGAATANYEYSPFGETLRADGVVAKANLVRFGTQFFDEATGRSKYMLRDYSAPIGKWLNRDPIQELGGQNLCAINANDLVNHVDPFGLKRLTLTYDFDLKAPWWEKLHEPAGTKWTQDLPAILKDTQSRIGKEKNECMCVEKLTLAGHSGVPGTVEIGKGIIDVGTIRRINEALSSARRQIAEKQIKREVDFLREASAYFCSKATVDFMQCSSGDGPDGQELLKFLKGILPPRHRDCSV